MLKSTKIALAQRQNALKEQAKSNELKRQEIEETKRHNLVEEETKDRVEISKKEYLELLEQNEQLRTDLNDANATIKKMLEPFLKAGISKNVYEKFLANEFWADISTFYDSSSLCENIRIIFRVPLDEMKE